MKELVAGLQKLISIVMKFGFQTFSNNWYSLMQNKNRVYKKILNISLFRPTKKGM
jgi:hypothetical protein